MFVVKKVILPFISQRLYLFYVFNIQCRRAIIEYVYITFQNIQGICAGINYVIPPVP